MGNDVSAVCCQPEMLDSAMTQKQRYEQFQKSSVLVKSKPTENVSLTIHVYT